MKRVDYFNAIRDGMLWRIPLKKGDPDTTCNGKHIILLQLLRSDPDIEIIKPQVCDFSWTRLFDENPNLPRGILRDLVEDEDSHLYLKANIRGRYIALDCTWDRGLQGYLPVNEWDGSNATKIAVHPLRIYTEEESLRSFFEEPLQLAQEDYTGKNINFYRAMNDFVDRARRQK